MDASAIADARGLFPLWVSWGSLAVVAATTAVASFAAVWAASAAALGLSRVRAGDPWPERARRAFAAKQAIGASCVEVPFLCSAAASIFDGPFSIAPASVLAIVAWGIALAVGLCRYRTVAQRLRDVPLPLARAWRGGATGALIMLSPYLPILAVLPFVPDELGREAVILFGMTAVAVAAFACGLGFRLARLAGLIRPASPRLEAVVAAAAARVGVRPRAVYEIEWPVVNAFAFPLSRSVAFTDTTLEHFSDQELEAICCHELGHLGESRLVTLVRVLRTLLFVPVVLAEPFVNTYGWIGLSFALLTLSALARLYTSFSRRLEARADAVVHRHADEGLYARALEKSHRINLTPVVLARGATHPDLYDRMLAAGVQPAYPRPQPPSQWAVPISMVTALVVSGALVLAGALALRTTFSGGWNDARALQAGLLLGGRWDAGRVARLARLREREGDVAAAATLYHAAAELDCTPWSAASYRATALALDRHCDEAAAALAEARAGYCDDCDPEELDDIFGDTQDSVEACRRASNDSCTAARAAGAASSGTCTVAELF